MRLPSRTSIVAVSGLLASLAATAPTFVFAGGPKQPVRNLQVTLRGKKYDIDHDVTTVAELQERVNDVASNGSGGSGSHSVLFDGKRLEPEDVLSDVGVSDGAQLSMVPSSSSSSSSSGKSKSKKSGGADKAAAAVSGSSSSAAAAAAAPGGTPDAMKEYLKQAGVDTDKLNDLVKGMGGGLGGAGGEGGGMPDMKESMEMMTSMMNSPIFQEYMSDPEKLEQSRQMILNNPMLKSMMGGMPGMEEILNSPEAWREAMQAAANLYKNMDQNDLMNAMMGGAGATPGAGAAPGSAGGLFDGTLDQSATAKALDELDEDD